MKFLFKLLIFIVIVFSMVANMFYAEHVLEIAGSILIIVLIYFLVFEKERKNPFEINKCYTKNYFPIYDNTTRNNSVVVIALDQDNNLACVYYNFAKHQWCHALDYTVVMYDFVWSYKPEYLIYER